MFHILSHLSHPSLLLFWQGSLLVFQRRRGKLALCWGYKVWQHSSDISSTEENSKEEEFLHSNTNAKISVYGHILSNGPYREFLKFLSVSCTCANAHTHARTHGKGVCFIPTRVENLCLIDYSLKIHIGFPILSSMSSDTILIEMPRRIL